MTVDCSLVVQRNPVSPYVPALSSMVQVRLAAETMSQPPLEIAGFVAIRMNERTRRTDNSWVCWAPVRSSICLQQNDITTYLWRQRRHLVLFSALLTFLGHLSRFLLACA